MKSTAVCVVRSGKAEFGALSKGIAVLARATRWLFARLFQGGEREADVKRDLLVGDGHGLLSTMSMPRDRARRPGAKGNRATISVGRTCAAAQLSVHGVSLASVSLRVEVRNARVQVPDFVTAFGWMPVRDGPLSHQGATPHPLLLSLHGVPGPVVLGFRHVDDCPARGIVRRLVFHERLGPSHGQWQSNRMPFLPGMRKPVVPCRQRQSRRGLGKGRFTGCQGRSQSGGPHLGRERTALVPISARNGCRCASARDIGRVSAPLEGDDGRLV